VNIHVGWPEDEALLDAADTLVFTGDTFPPQRMQRTAQILAKIDSMMQRGCGIACFHYATGLWGEDVPENGDHPLLRWMGGYFANKTCPHHQGIARIFPSAIIKPAAGDHPICRGWQAFDIHDEPYINNYFGPQQNQPAENVTILATSDLPPESPAEEPVSWCISREDGGRGFAVVMPHFYKNWRNESLRCLILNGIVWTGGGEIPATGIQTPAPDLDTFLVREKDAAK
jgi:type 1 glutamine amidotransferase